MTLHHLTLEFIMCERFPSPVTLNYSSTRGDDNVSCGAVNERMAIRIRLYVNLNTFGGAQTSVSGYL